MVLPVRKPICIYFFTFCIWFWLSLNGSFVPVLFFLSAVSSLLAFHSRISSFVVAPVVCACAAVLRCLKGRQRGRSRGRRSFPLFSSAFLSFLQRSDRSAMISSVAFALVSYLFLLSIARLVGSLFRRLLCNDLLLPIPFFPFLLRRSSYR
jgi:hypothetical protein